jgi:hypothetical protein
MRIPSSQQENDMRRILIWLFLATLLVATLLVHRVQAWQMNSTRKIRIQPTAFSGQCGSAVQWQPDLQKALQEATINKKPVFWYVPTIDGSFMDRKPVIDRYMLAGPFSWPAICRMVNEHFVPVKAAANPRWQQRYPQIKAYAFVEPGLVILNPDGSVQSVVDQITTLDPYWMAGLIAGWAGVATPPLWSDSLSGPASAFRAGRLDYDEWPQVDDSLLAERTLLQGMFLFRQGLHDRARQLWASARQLQPGHPLAWKAAAEAENWGPFVRGFEVHRQLPERSYRAGIESRGSAAPRDSFTMEQLWQRSADYLMGMQSQNGGWFDSDYDFGGTDSLPNVHAAVTALCGSALLEAAERLPEHRSCLLEAVDRAARYCADRHCVNPADRDEILWAHAYRVRFLARLAEAHHDWRARYAAALADAVTDLESMQTSRGTWYHEYANPFVTATALTALKRAAAAGASVDIAKIKRGVASLANDRLDNGAWPYYGAGQERTRGTPESSGDGMIPASAGRMPLCELALWQWEASSDERLQNALQAAFDNHRHLAAGYKYDNHTSTMAYGGFFFWYDMRGRAEALGYLADRQRQRALAARQRELVLALPELDGCFVDSHELGRCYGTAMALLTLSLLDRVEENQPAAGQQQ